MPDLCDDTLATQLVEYKRQLVAYNAAIFALGMDGIQSYQFDTGQTRQLVYKAQIGQLRETVGWLLEQISMLEAILGRTASTHVVPGF